MTTFKILTIITVATLALASTETSLFAGCGPNSIELPGHHCTCLPGYVPEVNGPADGTPAFGHNYSLCPNNVCTGCVADPTQTPHRPEQTERHAQDCNSNLAKSYFNERRQCNNRRDISSDVCRDLREHNPQQAAGCYAQTETVFAQCLQRLTTVYPPEILRCPMP
jgi:hypothetical protein